MHVITRKTLKNAWEIYPDVEEPLRTWYTVMKHTDFENFVALRQRYPSADQVGRLTVFNIRGNHYRLIVRIDYENKKVFIRNFLTHADYSKEEWKNDAWY